MNRRGLFGFLAGLPVGIAATKAETVKAAEPAPSAKAVDIKFLCTVNDRPATITLESMAHLLGELQLRRA